MKISLLTFSKETNFGANLQCYALCKVLQDMGHQVNIIDIQLRRYHMSWYSAIMHLPMVYLFRMFRKQYLDLFTKHFKSVKEVRRYCPQSDLYIVGSDQVWNPRITKRQHPLIYFFSFLPHTAHRISYAASFGTDTWDSPNLTSEVKNLLKRFDAISVREESGVKICNDVFNVNATLVADPTLLLKSYDNICGKYEQERETNDLTYYTFVHNSATQKILAEFARPNNLNAVVLRSNRSYPGFKLKMYVSVKEWLNSIRYSRLVVTTSFHCMVFCILFHKRFVAIPGKSERLSNRQLNLLKQLNLSEYYCPKTECLPEYLSYAMNNDIDYRKIDTIIESIRKQSINFLTQYCR